MNTPAKFLPLMLSVVPFAAMARVPKKPLPLRPNVIVILADDLGYGDLECYGAKGVHTPCVDALAQSGIRFTNAHAMASTSTPSRYAMLTGEYAFRKQGTDVAAGNAGMIISPEQFTMADAFRQAGYATGAIGKWHLGLGAKTGEQDWNGIVSPSLEALGFDYHYIMAATADRVPCVFIENGRVANYDPSAPIEVSYKQNFEGEPTGRNNPELLYNLRSSHGHDMSIVNGIGRIGYMKGGGRALWRDEDIADSIASHAVSFITSHADSAFFLYLATNDVHVPRFPHHRFRGKSTMGLRGDAIAQFDWTVGRVIEVLDSLHLRDNVDQRLSRRDLIVNEYDRTRMIDPLAEMLRTELLFRRVTVLLQKLRPRLHFRDFLTGRMDINAVLKAGTDTRPDRRRSLSKTDNEPCIRIFLCQPPSERMKHFQCTLRFDRQMLPL